MAKVVLVTPPIRPRERYGNLAIAGPYFPPLGLGYLASSLKRYGHRVEVLDAEALRLSLSETVRAILSKEPDLVGITSVTMSIHKAGRLAQELKKENSKLTIVVGGAHISVEPEATMKLFPEIDLGVLGEGEETLLDLAFALQNGKELEDVPGLILRKDGELLRTPARALIRDIDDLPFPSFELFPDLRRYYRPSAFGFRRLPCASLVTARGCPAECSFCIQSPWGKIYREHSADYVLEMIELLYHRYGVRDIAFYDGTFGLNKKRLLELCEKLIRKNLKLVWSCNGRAGLYDFSTLKLMKRAGCWLVAYGIESGAQELVDFMKKGITLEELKESLYLTRKAGIMTKGYIMVGTLQETQKTLQKTFSFVMKVDLDLLTVNHFTPLPGTLDYKRAHLYGKFNSDWRLLNEHNLVFVPRGLSEKRIESFIREISLKFYLRPKLFIRYLKFCWPFRSFLLLFLGFVSLLKFSFSKKCKC